MQKGINYDWSKERQFQAQSITTAKAAKYDEPGLFRAPKENQLKTQEKGELTRGDKVWEKEKNQLYVRRTVF